MELLEKISCSSLQLKEKKVLVDFLRFMFFQLRMVCTLALDLCFRVMPPSHQATFMLRQWRSYGTVPTTLVLRQSLGH